MVLDILMPYYGRFDHLVTAVNSVMAQSSPSWRLVVVDDVYPDTAPGEWVATLDDPRVSYIRNPENLGVSHNYRRCVELMSSEFAVLMGCDDIMRPRFVERVCEIIELFPTASIIQPGVEVVNGDDEPHIPLADRVKRMYRPRGTGAREYSGPRLASSLLRANWTYFPSLVWRVETIREIGFRLDLNVVQDLAMLVEINKRGGSLVLDDEVVFDYRRHATSVSAVTGFDGSKFRQERILFGEASRDLDALGWHGAARAARVHLTSRFNALTELPGAIARRDTASSRSIATHVLGGVWA